jgi:hypothetical protein
MLLIFSWANYVFRTYLLRVSRKAIPVTTISVYACLNFDLKQESYWLINVGALRHTPS